MNFALFTDVIIVSFQKEHREREFFVKWHDMCYWHCEWISELQVCAMNIGISD